MFYVLLPAELLMDIKTYFATGALINDHSEHERTLAHISYDEATDSFSHYYSLITLLTEYLKALNVRI